MKRYKKYYKKIKENQTKFENILECIELSDDINEKLRLAQTALSFAAYKNTGYFTSSKLEDFYINYAKTIDIDNYDIPYKKNSFLHILTIGYNIGGHTRVVERWIKNAPYNQTHSVALLYKTQEFKTLENNTKEKNGSCIYFEDNLTFNEKALKLRELALNYEYIILHTHMDDPIATVAFGVEKFTRPVIFYNHASHMFWLGKAISDITLDILKDDPITITNRDIKTPFNIGIPTEIREIKSGSKEQCRKKLNLPCDKKIIVSSGSKNKYSPICNDNIIKLIDKIIDKDTYFYVIGPTLDDLLWKKAYKKSKGHIVPLGCIDFDKGFVDYLVAADLYIDSTPLCSWTATMDAICADTPVLCHKGVLKQLDYLTQIKEVCCDKKELIKQAKKILNDKNYADEILNREKEMLHKMQSKENWDNKIEQLLKIVPKVHKVKDLSKENDYKKIEDLCVIDNFLSNGRFLKRKRLKQIKFELKYLRYKYINKNKTKQIRYLLETIK